MSKKNVKRLLVTTFGVLICLLIWGIVDGVLKRSNSESNSQSLPDVTILSEDNKVIRLSKVTSGKKTVIFFFNPDCEHCHSEAEEVIKYKRNLQDKNILWLSKEDLAAIKHFDKRYKLSEIFQSLHVAKISVKDADEKFGFREVPSIYIYDENGVLVKKYHGVTKIQNILNFL